MMKKTNILYLYSEIVGYNIPVFKEYVENYNAEVHVVHWDHKKLKPYIPEEIEGVFYYKRSEYNYKNILDLANHINPDIIYVSGWMDKDYLKVTKLFKKKGIPIVAGFDDIWFGNLRQRIASLVFPFYYKKYFTHAWVAGPYQFEFASRLGFKKEKIIFDLLTSDPFYSKNSSKEIFGSNFIYVGNFRFAKAPEILVKGFNLYKKKFHGKWNLIVIGSGDLESLFLGQEGIVVYPYLNFEEIIKISENAGAFILPSRHEPWGVVVNEFTSLGFPLLLSEKVGARAMLLIDGFNGFQFENENAEDLANKMNKVSDLSQDELKKMGNNSKLLSRRISVSSSAANFMSILYK